MSFQQIILVGNVGQDPEMRYTPTGVPVTSFSLAVNRVWNDQSGQRQEKTTWFRISAWQKLAETVSQYGSKGRQIMVIGTLDEARTYTDRDGNLRVSLEVRAQQIQFLGSRADGGTSQDAGIQPAERSQEPAGGGGGHMSDEDIPF